MKENQNTLLVKMFTVAVLIMVCVIPSLVAFPLIEDRKADKEKAAEDITEKWGGTQTIAGPILIIPYTVTRTIQPGIQTRDTLYLSVLPKDLGTEAVASPEERSRGIFSTIVYSAAITGRGTFELPDTAPLGIARADLKLNEALITLPISDSRGIEGAPEFRWNGALRELKPGSNAPIISPTGSGMHVPVALERNRSAYTFEYRLQLRGSTNLSFSPIGNTSQIKVSSAWKSPNFSGAFLPKSREIGPEGFSAVWEVPAVARPFPQLGNEVVINAGALEGAALGVTFDQGMELYDTVGRTVKYAILFVGLTFFVFFLFEVLSGLRLHPLQYLLIGFALGLFYLLLLSLSEYIGFTSAYLIAAAGTVGLIAAYCVKILKAARRGVAVGSLLTALYGYLYFITRLEDYALLVGSVALFGILAVVMYLTRNVDWYGIEKREATR